MKLLHCLLLAAVALTLLSFTLAKLNCPQPGTYFEYMNPEPVCPLCYRGSFCPGDDNIYNCPSGTIAPNRGQIKCNPCLNNNNRTNIASTVCLLPSTPLDSKEIYSEDWGDVYVPVKLVAGKRIYKYVSLTWFNLELGIPKAIEIEVGNYEMPLILYASTTVGNPDSSNYQYSFVGTNTTLTVPTPNIRNADYVVYLNFLILPMKGKNDDQMFHFKLKNIYQ